MELYSNSEAPGPRREKEGRATSSMNPLQEEEHSLVLGGGDHSREKPRDEKASDHLRIATAGEEEQKIRRELEEEIERGIEEEIRGEICLLARRLHGLYRHRRERRSMAAAFTKVKITLHVERGCTVEIDVSNGSGRPGGAGGRPWRSRTPAESKAKYGKAILGRGQLDWMSSLRSGTGTNPPAMSRHRETSRQDRDGNRKGSKVPMRAHSSSSVQGRDREVCGRSNNE